MLTRRRWRAGATLAGLTAVAVAAAAVTDRGAVRADPATVGVLPDMAADPPERQVLEADLADPSSPRLLLRFDSYIRNVGDGALEVRGDRADAGRPLTVHQRIYDARGQVASDVASSARLAYETGDGHRHWHLQQAARYSLWDEAGAAEVAPAMKTGFCLVDVEPVEPGAPAVPLYGNDASVSPRYHGFCATGMPGTRSTWQGISPGWRDLYDRQLAFQWVDVSDVQPGRYRLRAEVDPDDVVREAVEANAPAWAAEATVIPGYVARPVDAGVVPAAEPAAVTLGAERFSGALGEPGAVSYRIEAGPAHGSLSLAVGADQASPVVTYTPAPGFTGTDAFRYSARDASSPFPRSPATATVTVRVGPAPGAAAPEPAPAVSIGGAPAELVAGTSVQLSATVTGDRPVVAWSAGGVIGGTAEAGRVTPDGRYTAPDRPPASGAVEVAATSPRGARDARIIRIVPAPVPIAAPLPPAPAIDAPSRSARALLGALRVSRLGRRVIVGVTPRRSGLVRIAVRAAGTRLGRCAVRTPRDRRVVCRLRLPRGVDPSVRLHAVARLVRGRRVVAIVRAHPRTAADARAAHGHDHG